MTIKQRPKHLNLFKIRFPGTAIASILHRISGLFIFLLTPLLVYLFVLSLRDESGFSIAAAWFDSMLMKLILAVLIWFSLHHFVAGIRYLLLDLDIGLSKSSTRYSAFAVIGIALVLTVFTISLVVL